MKTVNVEECFSKQSGFTSFLYVCILLVGLHSIFLGLFIYLFTDIFYELFFSVKPGNVFYVKQSGVFLFCLGVYYLLPLIDFKQLFNMVQFTVFTKIVAVLFLITNAKLSLSSNAIYMAAFVDGIMATVLVFAFYSHRKCMNSCKM